MQYSTLTMSAAVLLALTPTALSLGKAHVVNNCDFPVYYASIAQGIHQEMQELPTDGFTDDFVLPGVGVSIKLATSTTEKPTQFEYTWAAGKIWYDISNIDGNPFAKHGMVLSPSIENDPLNPSCKNVTCAAGESTCSEAYNLPNDVRTMVCSEDTDLTMTLCPSTSTDAPVVKARAVDVQTRQHARQFSKA